MFLRLPQKHPALFTDVQMPPGVLNGFDLARTCATNWAPYRNFGFVWHDQAEPGDMPEGAVFVGKPFNHAVVVDRLQELLPDGKKPERLKLKAKRAS